MTKKLKVITVITLLLIVLSAYAAGNILRSTVAKYMVDGLLHKGHKEFANYFYHSYWTNYQGTLTKLINKPVSEWQNDPGFVEMALKFFEKLKFMPYVEVRLLTKEGVPFLSNIDIATVESEASGVDHWFLGDNLLISKAEQVSMAMRGQSQLRIIPDAKFLHPLGGVKHGAIVESVTPIRNQKGETILLIGVSSDFTEAWQFLASFKKLGMFSVFAAFILLGGGLIIIMYHSQNVITKQHELNAELTERIKKVESESVAKSLFLANVSHELRTPLNAIIGFSEIIKKEELGPISNQKYKDYINDINTSGTHLLALINDILDYSKAEANKLTVEEVEVDVGRTAKACLRLVSPRAEHAGVHLIDGMTNDTVIIMADPKRFKQVLLNLLSNSVKFTDKDGKVTLASTLDLEAQKILIKVIDTGIGISPDNISRALATFEQVDSTRSRKYEGTGLGLPLTKKLVEIMKGKFHIQSEEGLGTTVTVVFPIKSYTPVGNGGSNTPVEVTVMGSGNNAAVPQEEVSQTAAPQAVEQQATETQPSAPQARGKTTSVEFNQEEMLKDIATEASVTPPAAPVENSRSKEKRVNESLVFTPASETEASGRDAKKKQEEQPASAPLQPSNQAAGQNPPPVQGVAIPNEQAAAGDNRTNHLLQSNQQANALGRPGWNIAQKPTNPEGDNQGGN